LELLLLQKITEGIYQTMSLSKYVLRGKITAVDSPTAESASLVELLAWLDVDAQKTPSDALAKVKRQYAKEVLRKGCQVDWQKPVLALPAPEVQPNQLLFSFPGVQVYELPVGTLT
jgi:hypothetical protein